MKHDTDYPKETVEEREQDVFVPPGEQHIAEDGTPADRPDPVDHTDAAGPRSPETEDDHRKPGGPEMDTDRDRTGMEHTDLNDSDRTHFGRTDFGRTDSDQTDSDQTDSDPTDSHRIDLERTDPQNPGTVPATPLDTGTAEDAERAEEIATADQRADERVDETVDGSERAEDAGHDEAVARAEEAGVVEVAGIERAGGRDEVAVGIAPVPGAIPEQPTVLDDYADDSEMAGPGDFWPSGIVEDLRGRWDTVQMRFVDDPAGVAADARALVGDTLAGLRDAADSLEARLDEAGSEPTGDTEALRQRVAHYRNVFESLLSR